MPRHLQTPTLHQAMTLFQKQSILQRVDELDLQASRLEFLADAKADLRQDYRRQAKALRDQIAMLLQKLWP